VQADSAEHLARLGQLGEKRWRCVVGAGGVREDKVEGDGRDAGRRITAAPHLFPQRPAGAAQGRAAGRPIAEHDGWCDDPRSPSYNRLVRVPNDWSHEKMWREDGLYDPRRRGRLQRRSAGRRMGQRDLPAHRADDYSPTQGCVAFKREDLLELVSLIGPETKINVLSIPANETSPAAKDGENMKQFEDFDEQDW
jgi:L,D-peptidoglycan transpeptidase YkuD (ErfK/YbiS/YcfS/YnhG family)